MKTRISQIQQGDVVLSKLAALPPGQPTIVAKRRCVLAEGEATGHAHVVEDDKAELITIGEKMLLRLGKQAVVTHEEHKPITLDPGIYEIGRVAEYDYFSQMTRNVAD